MCGIFGIFSINGISAQSASTMSRSLRPRGPDDEGTIFFDDSTVINLKGDDTPTDVASKLGLARSIRDIDSSEKFKCFMGHRRLSIQDLSENGHQPMNYLQRYWVVFNGEIYNYIEIREELKSYGYIFNSNSDTEVLLASFDKWGPECLTRFNGMWSFVLYDIKTKNVFISRDRFGVKPFYFSSQEGCFIFGSEPKAILSTHLVEPTPNIKYIEKYLKNGPNESTDSTAFANIQRLNCSSYIHCHINELILGNYTQVKFWSLNPNCSSEPFNQAKAKQYAKRYLELLEDSVRLRLRADVKVGSALSGGLDSSSIVYLVNKIQKENGLSKMQETFSCVYTKPDEKYCDESEFIDTVAKFLDVHSNKIEPNFNDLPYEHDLVTWAMDTPFANSSMSGWHTYKLIHKKGVVVSLEGQGADEQLAGYLGYIYVYLSNLSLRDLVKESLAFSKIPSVTKHVLAGVVFNLLIKVGLYNLANVIYKLITKSDLPLDRSLNKRLVNDSMNGLVNLLHYADRVSMAHSIESRMPFLDYRLAEFFASVPACYKMHGGWTKYIARLAFDGLLPDNICWRRDKMGWPVPEKLWLNGPLKEWFWKSLEGSKLVERYVKQRGVQIKPDLLPESFYYVNLAAWEKKFSIKV